MNIIEELKRQWQIQRSLTHPNPLELTYEDAISRPGWNYHERKAIRDKMRRKNPLRFARLETDMIWLRKQLIKEGLDPTQARWLL